MRLILIALLLISSAAKADGPPISRAEHLEICKVDGQVAQLIMRARQSGSPMPEIMGIVGDNRYNQMLVEVAYTAPRFHTEKAQQREVTEFQNIVYGSCVGKIPGDAR